MGFNGNVIHSINQNPPMKEINNLNKTIKLSEDSMVKNIEEGNFTAEVPYCVFMKNNQTNGIAVIGVSDIYPFKMFPTYLELEDFQEMGVLGFEPLPDFDRFCSSLEKIKNPEENFVFSIFDVSSIESFDVSNIKYREKLSRKSRDNYFSLITIPPSLYLPKEVPNNYLTELSKNIFFSGTGTNLTLEF